MKVLGIGNALVDVLIELENDNILQELSLPKGSMQLIDSRKLEAINRHIKQMHRVLIPGGSATNTITSLSQLGISTGMIGKINDDEIGNSYKQDLTNRGVIPQLLKGDLPSGRATTFISRDGERTFATYLGAASTLQADELKAEMFDGYDLMHIEGYLLQSHTLIERAMQLAKQAGCLVSMDMASYNIVEENLEFIQYLLEKYVDIVFANEEEAHAFYPQSLLESLKALARITQTAVVKLGGKGSMVMSGEEFVEVPALPVQKIDTTGAGDNYAAGFLFGLVNSYPLSTCAEIGSLLAGHVITVIGTKLDQMRWETIKKEIRTITSR